MIFIPPVLKKFRGYFGILGILVFCLFSWFCDLIPIDTDAQICYNKCVIDLMMEQLQ